MSAILITYSITTTEGMPSTTTHFITLFAIYMYGNNNIVDNGTVIILSNLGCLCMIYIVIRNSHMSYKLLCNYLRLQTCEKPRIPAVLMVYYLAKEVFNEGSIWRANIVPFSCWHGWRVSRWLVDIFMMSSGNTRPLISLKKKSRYCSQSSRYTYCYLWKNDDCFE